MIHHAIQSFTHKRVFIFLLVFSLLHKSVSAQWGVETAIGNGSPGYINGSPDSAMMNGPFGVCRLSESWWPTSHICISDAGNHVIREADPMNNFVISTKAGTGIAGYADGPALQAKFNSPAEICSDDSLNIYVADFLNHRIRMISYDGMVTTIAGSGIAGYQDGPSNTARFNYPRGICRDYQGNLYVGDSWNHRIRKITPDGMVLTLAGGGAAIGVGSAGAWVDGQDTAARFWTPTGLDIDPAGNIYVADAYNHRVRMINTQGYVNTVAGSGPSGPGQGAFLNGPFSSSRLNTPTGVLYAKGLAPGSHIFVSDTYNNVIRDLNLTTSQTSTFAGNGQQGFNPGYVPANQAMFHYPRQLAEVTGIDLWTLYIIDCNNHALRYMPICTGLEDNQELNVRIYPNPFRDKVKIELTGPVDPNMRFLLTDLCGRPVLSFDIPSPGIMDLDPGLLNSGIYFLRLINGSGRLAGFKLVKI